MKNMKEKLNDMGIKSINNNIQLKESPRDLTEKIRRKTVKEIIEENFKIWNKEICPMMSLPTQCYINFLKRP